ncbi:hypothetical protein ILYODFUR_011998 [Ilyodon furcidens]|uniref:Uncharacterized protein n=1 Tax=Ilyodon furcidens TaxID=33524 RepID=A0ABV0TLL3_9TELE
MTARLRRSFVPLSRRWVPEPPLCVEVVFPLGDDLTSLVRAWPTGFHEEQLGHQVLSDKSQPQAWLQGGILALPYRVTSLASIVWSS